MEKLYYFCPHCDKHEVLKDSDNRCPECGGKCLAVVASPDAIPTGAELQEELAALEVEAAPQPTIHDDSVFAYRFSLFMEMGFGPVESDALANTREDTHRIRKMLREGCAIDTAVAILL